MIKIRNSNHKIKILKEHGKHTCFWFYKPECPALSEFHRNLPLPCLYLQHTAFVILYKYSELFIDFSKLNLQQFSCVAQMMGVCTGIDIPGAEFGIHNRLTAVQTAVSGERITDDTRGGIINQSGIAKKFNGKKD